MKKLLLVPVVAALAAAGAASAAGLDVTQGAPLQTGTTTKLDCAASATVSQWGTDEGNGAGPVVLNAEVKLAPGHTCAGRMFVYTLDGTGAEFGPSGSVQTTPGVDSYRVQFGDATQGRDARLAGGAKAAQVEGARITIDQGFTDYDPAGASGR